MECVICSTSIFHLYHEPVFMGCGCSDKCCHHCFTMGEMTQCPTCRKEFSHKTDGDLILLTTLRSRVSELIPCLGCNKKTHVEILHDHEKCCAQYRDYYDNLLKEDVSTKTNALDTYRDQHDNMAESLQLQREHIETLEDLIVSYEEDTRIYKIGDDYIMKSLSSLHAPLESALQQMKAINEKIHSACQVMKRNRRMHRVMSWKRRRLMENDSESSGTATSSSE